MRLNGLADAICLALVAACSIAWYGCSLSSVLGRAEPGPFVRLTMTESSRYMKVRLRRRIAIDLPEKPGYKWVLTERPDANVLKPESYAPAHELLEGVPMEIVYFYCAGKGTASLRLEQVGEHGGPPIDHFSLTLYVAGDREFH